MIMNFVKDIDILLIGKTGNGKSRTGNTILGRDVFEYTNSSTSVTRDVQDGYVQYDNRTIKVVDCPGIEDTNNMDDVEKATSYLIETMGDVVIKHPDGYHAFLFVVKYGNRCTAEDKRIIKTLKSIFGAEIISQFSILLMTHGDLFSSKNKTNKSFKQWCLKQTGVLKDLMEECGNRIVLFDNETKDEEKLDKQMKKLIKTIDYLQYRGMRHNHEYYQRAEKNRDYLLVEAKLPRILQETSNECRNISSEFEKLKNDTSDECKEKLKCLQNRASEIKNQVQKEDNKTGALNNVIVVVDSLLKMISNRLYSFNAIRQKEGAWMEEKTAILRIHNERMKNLQETYGEKTKDAQHLEKEKQKVEKKLLDQEEGMQVNLKHLLDNAESERSANQCRLEELEKEEEKTSLLELHDERMIIVAYKEKRAKDAQRLEMGRKEMEKKWTEQEERMQAELKRILDSIDSVKNSYQRRVEELEKEYREKKEEAKIQAEEKIATLLSSMNDLMEREANEKTALQEECNRKRKIEMEEQKNYNDKFKVELEKARNSLLMEKNNVTTQNE